FRMHIKTVDIRKVIFDSIESLTFSASQRGITIDSRIAPDLGMIPGDDIRLGQVVTNLLSNAIKFSPEESKVDVFAIRGDLEMLIEVQDYGDGIEEEKLACVFDRFWQADSSDSRRVGGLG